ncbi:unnamed protein product [Mytilus coruscus]|uniref:DDE Tnp4 domain-containing protein n=1 Tax=Mytilus coruscus TaxID=42192 RepID=A0A6J8A7R1_MYTCO|nr:unnamed protein product [Mytilus coruscus]
MIRRPLGYEPLAHHRVCSRHFVQDSNVPELFQWNNYRGYESHRSLASIVKRNSDINAGEVPEPTVDVNNNPEPEAESLVITNEQPREVVNNRQDDHSYSRASTSTGTMCSTFIDTGVQTDLTLTDIEDILLENDQPKTPTVNARTYSTYKSHNTFKFLVSITPTGAFNFISNMWGVYSSDRYITEHSGFLNFVSPGGEIMADRGFTIRDLLTERKAYLTIPSFTRKCKWGKDKYLNVNEIKKN